MARAPAASAPTQADMDECSDSTGTKTVSTCPSATYWAKYWGISVEGVMGKAAKTSGLIWRMAVAMASLPDRRSRLLIYSSSFPKEIASKGQTL